MPELPAAQRLDGFPLHKVPLNGNAQTLYLNQLALIAGRIKAFSVSWCFDLIVQLLRRLHIPPALSI